MNRAFSKFVGAVFVYACFSVYLYKPFFELFAAKGCENFLFAISPVLAAAGCFVICRRWTAGWVGAFFAGALYGFGPYISSLAGLSPAAGMLAAAVPWLFWPATFACKYNARWLRIPLGVLPFAAIAVFFLLDDYFRLFLIPTQTRLNLSDLAGLVTPLAMVNRSPAIVGIFHVAIAPAMIGIAMMVEARRYWVMLIFAAGLVLSLFEPVLGVSSVMWPAIAVMCLCVAAGVGMSAMAEAGARDSKWVLGAGVVLAAFCTLLIAAKHFQFFAGLTEGQANILITTGRLYMLGTAGAGLIYFMAHVNFRHIWVRWAILSTCIGIDIFLGASFIVDRMF